MEHSGTQEAAAERQREMICKDVRLGANVGLFAKGEKKNMLLIEFACKSTFKTHHFILQSFLWHIVFRKAKGNTSGVSHPFGG